MDRVVCRCLQVTETELREAIARCQLQTIRDVACSTGAGDGCTACHRTIQQFLRSSSCPMQPKPVLAARSA
jgi:bacterioferritin-associated ferredoxin